MRQNLYSIEDIKIDLYLQIEKWLPILELKTTD